MLTTAVKVKNLAFLVLGIAVTAYLGFAYADLGHHVGLRDHYRVRVELDRTGGLFTGSKVTYRGVSVGRVDAVELTGRGVEATLHIDTSAPPIPAELTAQVAALSAVGEQYIDLSPVTDTGPHLADGDVVPRRATSTPPHVTTMLTSVNALAASVDTESLRTVVDELGQAFQGRGEDLQVLLDATDGLLDAADEALPATTRLVVDAESVLRTQREEGTSLRAFAGGTKKIAAELKDHDGDLRRLVTETPGAVDQVTALLRDVDPHLSVLLANLTTTSELLVTRQRGVEELMVQAPRAVAAGATAVTDGKLRLGMTVTFFEPLPCTAGYQDTVHRSGRDTSPPPLLNTEARCTAPPGSGRNVRGSANAPHGPVPEPAVPGALTGSRPDSPGDAPRDLGGLLGLDGDR